MLPADGVHLLALEDGAVLLDEPAQKLFYLDTAARYLWCQLVLETTEKDTELAMQEKFSITESDAKRHVARIHGLFQQMGVIQGFEAGPEADSDALKRIDRRVDYDNTVFVAERRYRLLGSNARVRFTRATQEALVDPVLQHLAAPEDPPATIEICIIAGINGHIDICQDNQSRLSCESNDQIAPLVKSLLWQAAIAAHDYFLDIHAGVVSDGRQCLLFPAASGSGKSTLIAALVQHGFEYYSDEAALLHEPDFSVEPVPLAICVKNSGVKVLSRYYPGLDALAAHRRSDGKSVRYLTPHAMVTDNTDTRRPVSAIIFPCYSPERATSLTPINTTEALQMLMRECLIVDTHLDVDKVSRLLSWLEATPRYRLTVSHLDEAVQLVVELNAPLS